MAITSSFNSGRIDEEIRQQKEMLYSKILNSFINAGLKFIVAAREQVQDHALGTYLDDTTNLRNSIQFFVLYEGNFVHESDSEFSESNKTAVRDIINPDGFQLILIAGMNYASYVESKGYNVISYQSDLCFVDLTLYLEELKFKEEGSASGIEDAFTPGELPENFIVR